MKWETAGIKTRPAVGKINRGIQEMHRLADLKYEFILTLKFE
jgi:hypothetical protein